jgi:hypothetical protein
MYLPQSWVIPYFPDFNCSFLTAKLYRLRKGKACVRPEDEEQSVEHPHLGLLGSTIPAERLNRPLIRPVSLEPSNERNVHPPPVARSPPPRLVEREPPPIAIPPPPAKQNETDLPPVAIPPPPAKHIERERFFQEKKDVSGLSGHVRGLSLDSRKTGSSRSGSTDFSDWLSTKRTFLFIFLIF